MIDDDIQVIRNDERSRYELIADGDVAAYAEFEMHGDTVVMPRTVTDPRHRGRGFAAVVVRHALDDIRSSGRSVVPSCWYVAEFVERHPEYADLVAP